ncbi:MAG TPA: murein biosynthesis integral membrane protein MurJ [Candidatus Saccharimonadia bacterium]|nr:murein biosynthesis integral membrane protein MurJ [Candidatus Saccharimonadia bacterium]
MAFLHRFQNGAKWLEQQQTSILSAAVIITASIVLSSVTGLISYRLLASKFYNPNTKTQEQLDAYWVAFQPSDLVFQFLVVGALSAAFIPVFTRYKKKSEEDAFIMTSSVINAILLIYTIVAAALFIFAEPVIRAMTGPDFTIHQVALAANMTRVMLFAQFFFSVSNYLAGMIQSYQRFIIPALSPVAYNLGIIFGTLVLGQYFGIYGPVYGVVIGAFAHMALQIPLARKLGFKYYFHIDWKHPGLQEILKLTLPRTVSDGIDLIQPYFLTFFVTSLAGASLTLLRFSQKLMTIPIRMFGVTIGQAALPFLSEETSEGDMDRFRGLMVQSIHQITFFALPASMLLLILRIPIVRFAFGAKNFPWPDTVLTGRIVAIFALSVAAQAITHILVRGFYAMHDTKRPFFVSLSSMILGVLLGWYVTYLIPGNGSMKLLWLAGTLSITGIYETVALFILLHARVQFKLREVIVPQAKMILAGALMAIGLYFPMKALDAVIFDTTRTFGLFLLTAVVSIIGMLVYIFFAWILRLEELSILRNLLNRTGAWRKTLAKSEEAIEPVGVGQEG